MSIKSKLTTTATALALIVGVDPELGRDVLRSQVHDEALLGLREGQQQAPVKAGVRDAQVRERLWLALATRHLGDSVHSPDGTLGVRHSPAATPASSSLKRAARG